MNAERAHIVCVHSILIRAPKEIREKLSRHQRVRFCTEERAFLSKPMIEGAKNCISIDIRIYATEEEVIKREAIDNDNVDGEKKNMRKKWKNAHTHTRR